MVYPKSTEETRTEFTIMGLALVDLVFLAFSFILLVLVGGGNIPNDENTQLTLWHLLHLLVAVPGLLLCCIETIYLGVYYGIIGIILIIADTVILISRILLVINMPMITVSLAALLLLIIDIIFLMTAIGYAVTAFRKYSLTDSEDDDLLQYVQAKQTSSAAESSVHQTLRMRY